MAHLEHINLRVADGAALAQLLQEVFGWHTRWRGVAGNGRGYTRHVGTARDYLAIYEEGDGQPQSGKLNHIGIVVDDLDAIQNRLAARGIETFNHGAYEPGRRFYFHDSNGVEIEVVSYS